MEPDCPVQWRRSARARQLSLRIDPRAGGVVVTLPLRATRRAGLALLAAHAGWVRERIAALTPPIAFVPGARVPLGGVLHRLRLAPAGADLAWRSRGAIHIPGDAGTLAARTAGFLHAEAARRFHARVEHHAARLGVRARAIRIKDTRSRWASCALDGTLAFSWRLVMAPDWVLDTVAAHEVAHLIELNHSDRFQALVARLTPHGEATTMWLRRHGPGLLRVG